jgi:PAS domain S-box-containing protein
MADLSEPLGLPRRGSSEPKAAILLVDDNPANLLSLRAILDDLGQALVEAHSGEEAIRRAQAEDFAVVLLDVLMPGVSGFETARAIRGHERSRHTPIIFLAAGGIDRSETEEAYRLGAVDFLVKPLLPVALRAKVRGFVELFQEKQRAQHEAEQLRLLVHGTADYAIFMLGPDGRIATWNTGAERLKGYKAEEIIGQHFSRFYPQEAIDRGWPEHELRVAAREGRFEDEGWRLRQDGSRFWANVVITALRDERGELRGFSKVTRDLTERKRAEEDARRLAEEATARRVAEENARLIQEQRERLRVTLASIGDAVLSTDAEGRIDYLNPVAERLVGWTTAEAAGRAVTDVFRIVHEQTRRPVESPPLRALAEGAVVGLADHTVLIARDGGERPVDDSAAPIRDAGGRVVGSVLVFRDISERRRAEQQRNARLAVTHALSEAAAVEDGAGGVLRAVCENLGWDVGLFWAVQEQGGRLDCRQSWHRPDVPVDGLERASRSRTFTALSRYSPEGTTHGVSPRCRTAAPPCRPPRPADRPSCRLPSARPAAYVIRTDRAAGRPDPRRSPDHADRRRPRRLPGGFRPAGPRRRLG